MSWMRALGRSGLQVSALGLGTVKLGRNRALRYPGHFALPDERSAAALLDTARDLGINLLDTAPAYGSSEQRLGRLLRGQRQHWLLCTKVGERFDGRRSHFDFSPESTRASVLASLQRLHTEVLDIVLVHSDGDDQAIIDRAGTLETLAELKREGLLRSFGLSGKTVAGGLRAAQCCDVVMLTHNLGDDTQVPVLDACARLGTAALVKKPLCSGHLPARDAERFIDRSMRRVLGHAGTSSAVVGTLSPQHLRENVAAARRATGGEALT